MNVFDRSRTARINVPRSRQGGLSFTRTQTMDYGVLAPNYLQKVYPNDTFTIKTTNFMRTVPMVTPMLSRVRLFQRFYFVPFRVLWEPFEKYIFGGSNGDFTAVEPYFHSANTKFNSDNTGWTSVVSGYDRNNGLPQTLWDFFNFPLLTGAAVRSSDVSAFPFAAYHMIYNYGYRNENIQTNIPNTMNLINSGTPTSPAVTSWAQTQGYSVASLSSKWEDLREWSLVDGFNFGLSLRNDSGNRVLSPMNLNTLHYVNFPLDYFTSLNPWQQRGTGGKIPVRGFGDGSSTLKLNDIIALFDNIPSASARAGYLNTSSSYSPYLSGDNKNLGTISDSKGFSLSSWIQANSPSGSDDYSPTGYALRFSDKSEQNLFINMDDFRLARAIQVMQELSARGGIRFAEGLQSFFGTAPSDARLQEPQFLGGFVQDLNVSEVVQQSEDNKTPLGTLGGKGTSAGSGTIRVHVKEHGLIMGLVHILPDIVYHQGLSREWRTRSRYDWFWPNFVSLSEQPVYGYELKMTNDDAYNESVLGYQGRYNELRWRANEACGGFRDTSNLTGSFEYYKPWISLRTFEGKPTLSEELITSKGNISHDNFYVTDPSKMWPFMLDSYHKVRAVRPITRIPIPSRV